MSDQAKKNFSPRRKLSSGEKTLLVLGIFIGVSFFSIFTYGVVRGFIKESRKHDSKLKIIPYNCPAKTKNSEPTVLCWAKRDLVYLVYAYHKEGKITARRLFSVLLRLKRCRVIDGTNYFTVVEKEIFNNAFTIARIKFSGREGYIAGQGFQCLYK